MQWNSDPTPPPDIRLKLAIEQAAAQSAFYPTLQETLRAAAQQTIPQGFRFVVDPTAEGHAYFRQCLQYHLCSGQRPPPPPTAVPGFAGVQMPPGYALPVSPESLPSIYSQPSPFPPHGAISFGQGPPNPPSVFQPAPPRLASPCPPVNRSNYDIQSLVLQYCEPTAPPNYKSVAYLFDGLLTSLASELQQSLTAQTFSGQYAAAKKLSSISWDKMKLPESKANGCAAFMLRDNLVSSQDFGARSAKFIIAYRLFVEDSDWRASIGPFFVWLLRLVWLLASTKDEQNFALDCLGHARSDLGIFDDDEYAEMMTLIRCPQLPSVASFYNTTSSSLAKRRSRFDVSTPADGSLKRLKLGPNVEEGAVGVSYLAGANTGMASTDEGTGAKVPTSSLNEVDPELLPVGLLATMLKRISKRARNIQAAFIPYRPLDPALTPTSVPSAQCPTQYLHTRLAELEEAVDGRSSESGPEKVSSRRGYDAISNDSRNRIGEDDGPKHLSVPRMPRGFTEVGSGLTSDGHAAWEKPVSWAQQEMGVADDGSSLGGIGLGRLGVGAGCEVSKSAADSLFDNYRKHRAKRYHETIAAAHARASEEEKQCYICQNTGHFARECKFGLT